MGAESDPVSESPLPGAPKPHRQTWPTSCRRCARCLWLRPGPGELCKLGRFIWPHSAGQGTAALGARLRVCECVCVRAAHTCLEELSRARVRAPPHSHWQLSSHGSSAKCGGQRQGGLRELRVFLEPCH